MKWDRTEHPVSQAAVRLIFACFIGFCVLGLVDAMREQPRRPAGFWVAGAVLAFLFGCAVVAYFRQRGIAAFVVRSAFVGLCVVGELFLASSHLAHFLSEGWAVVLAVVVLAAWLLLAARRAWLESRA